MLPLRLRAVWLGIGALGIGLAFVLSLWPHGAPALANVPDKAQHLVGYGLVVAWFVGVLPRRWYGWVFLGAVLLGGLIEILQSFTETRQADWADEAANALGAAIGWVAAYLGLGGWAATVERWLGVVPIEPRDR
jgi:VanZ family protein